MNREDFKKWLENYKNAWEKRSPKKAAELFSADATYRETPFDEPMRGREAIVKYWLDVERSQENISFAFEILSVEANKGIAHWQAEFDRIENGKTVKLDGILIAFLNHKMQCTKFEEWWHFQEDSD